MKVTDLIQIVGGNYVDAAKHHLASIAEIIDKKAKNISVGSTVESINEHMAELEKIPGKNLVDQAKYQGSQGNLYLITQDELEGIARMFNKVSELVPVHHVDALASMLATVQLGINEIKKD